MEDKDKNKISCDLLKNVVELEKYLFAKAKNHKNYKYYTKDEYAKNIFDENAIFLSNGERWNDINDKKRFNSSESDVVRFGFCLSFSRKENVAMWMLYSRNYGCMIDFDKAAINEILSTSEVSLGYFCANKFVEKTKLMRDKFQVAIYDIVYYSDNENYKGYYVKHSDETNKDFPRKIINKLEYQKKSVEWSYENECRIVVTVPKECISNLSEINTIKICISEKSINNAKARTYDSPNVKTKRFQDSKMKSNINWNLCSGCNKKQEEL